MASKKMLQEETGFYPEASEDEITHEVHSNSRQIAVLGQKLALSTEEISHWNTLLTRIHLTSNHEKAEAYWGQPLRLTSVVADSDSRTITTSNGPIQLYKAVWFCYDVEGNDIIIDTYSKQPYIIAQMIVEEVGNKWENVELPIVFYGRTTKQSQGRETTFIELRG